MTGLELNKRLGSRHRPDQGLLNVYLVFLIAAGFAGWLRFSVSVAQVTLSASVGNAILVPLLILVLFHTQLRIRNVFAVAMILSMFVASAGLFAALKEEGHPSAQFLVTALPGMATLLVTVQVVKTRRQLTSVLRILVAVTVALAVVTIVAHLPGSGALPLIPDRGQSGFVIPSTGIQIPFRRQIAIPVNFETFGALASLASVSLLWNLFDRRRPLRLSKGLSLALIVLILCSVVVMQARGNFIGIGFALALITMVMRFSRLDIQVSYGMLKRWIFVLILIGVLAGFLFLVVLSGGSGDTAFNVGLRISYIEETLDGLRSAPLFGVIPDKNTHSSYLQLIVLGGPIPLLALIALVILVFRSAGRGLSDATDPRVPVIIGFATILVLNLFYIGVFEKFFFLFVGLALVSGHLNEGDEVERPAQYKLQGPFVSGRVHAPMETP